MPEEYRKTVYTSIVDQIDKWEREKSARLIQKEEKKGIHPFVTISREYGCGGYETAVELSLILSAKGKKWIAFDRKVIESIMQDMGVSRKLAETLTTQTQSQMATFFNSIFASYPPQVAVHRKLAETIRTLTLNGYVIIVGRGSNIIARDLPKGFHVRLLAPMDWKIARIVKIMGKKPKEAEKIIQEKSAARENFYREFMKFDPSDPFHYDMIINNASFTSVEAAKIIAAAMVARGLV